MAAIPTVREVNLTKDISTGHKYLNGYRLISKLGSGHNGKVYLAESTLDSTRYAIKEISKVTKLSITNKDPKLQINRICNEIDIMKLIVKHPKILTLHEVLDDDKLHKVFLVLEYCAQGELKFGAAHNYSMSDIRMILRDVILGLEYLHGIGVLHRDIKPSNLLKDEEGFIKISDFGISLNTNQEQVKVASLGTPAFLAPEICSGSATKGKDNTIDGKTDIWALGITLYCLWLHKLPFNGANEYELLSQISNNEIDIPEPQNEDEEQLGDLLEKMLQKTPKHRINMNELKNHRFVTADLSPSLESEFLRFNESYLNDQNPNFSRTKSIQRKFRSIFRRKPSVASDGSSLTTTPEAIVDNEGSAPELSTPSTPSAATSPKWRSAFKSDTMASSSNSLNLNSLLRSKKDVPNYLDDATFFQGMDSEESSSDDTDDESDEAGLYNEQDTLSFRIGPKRASSSLAMKTMNDYLDI